MFEIIPTEQFDAWLQELKDRLAAAHILARLVRIADGNLGDVKPVGDGVGEIRIHYGPGYRVYFIRDGLAIIILLCGGSKGSQKRDIADAKRLAKKWKE